MAGISHNWRGCGGDDVAVHREFGQLGWSGENFEAVYVTGSGEERRVPWRWTPDVMAEAGMPARSFRIEASATIRASLRV